MEKYARDAKEIALASLPFAWRVPILQSEADSGLDTTYD
jgi:hypothetical protein